MPILAALVLGPVISAATDKSDRPAALVEAVQPGRRRDAQGTDRRGQGQASTSIGGTRWTRSSTRCARSTTATRRARSSSPSDRRDAGSEGPLGVGILPPVRTLPARITETIAPSAARTAASAGCCRPSIVNNIGDGVAIAAGPLLVASLTRDPFLVSLALLSEYLPILLFGVLGRRRRRSVRPTPDGRRRQPRPGRRAGASSSPRSSAGPSASPSSWSRCSSSAPPRPSPTRRAARSCRASSRARTSASRTPGCRARSLLTNQLLAPPIGAFLFAIGMALPFATNAACFALGRGAGRRGSSTSREARAGASTRACAPTWPRASAGSWRHPPMRTLALTIFAVQRHVRGGLVACSSSTRASGSAWTPSGSAC